MAGLNGGEDGLPTEDVVRTDGVASHGAASRPPGLLRDVPGSAVDNRLRARIGVRVPMRHPARPRAAAGVGEVEDPTSGAGARPEVQPGAAETWVAARGPAQGLIGKVGRLAAATPGPAR